MIRSRMHTLVSVRPVAVFSFLVFLGAATANAAPPKPNRDANAKSQPASQPNEDPQRIYVRIQEINRQLEALYTLLGRLGRDSLANSGEGVRITQEINQLKRELGRLRATLPAERDSRAAERPGTASAGGGGEGAARSNRKVPQRPGERRPTGRTPPGTRPKSQATGRTATQAAERADVLPDGELTFTPVPDPTPDGLGGIVFTRTDLASVGESGKTLSLSFPAESKEHYSIAFGHITSKEHDRVDFLFSRNAFAKPVSIASMMLVEGKLIWEWKKVNSADMFLAESKATVTELLRTRLTSCIAHVGTPSGVTAMRCQLGIPRIIYMPLHDDREAVPKAIPRSKWPLTIVGVCSDPAWRVAEVESDSICFRFGRAKIDWIDWRIDRRTNSATARKHNLHEDNYQAALTNWQACSKRATDLDNSIATLKKQIKGESSPAIRQRKQLELMELQRRWPSEQKALEKASTDLQEFSKTRKNNPSPRPSPCRVRLVAPNGAVHCEFRFEKRPRSESAASQPASAPHTRPSTGA